MINKKLLNISAFLLFVWIVWAQYNQNVHLEALEEKKAYMKPSQVGEAKYTITIDPNKKVEDYSWVEWIIYKLYLRSNPEPANPKQEQALQTSLIPPKSRITYNCKPNSALATPTWCAGNKEALLGSGTLPSGIEEAIMQAKVGQSIRVGLPYVEVFGKQGDVGQMLFFDMQVEKIVEHSGNVNTNTDGSK
ncbi:MAG: hypothetical protein JSS50_04310 [Proteobacteria bacterium]|nr:hypothetical protein [Pseudomonadota bacterium]